MEARIVVIKWRNYRLWVLHQALQNYKNIKYYQRFPDNGLACSMAESEQERLAYNKRVLKRYQQHIQFSSKGE
jgi:hypothetical protein